MTDPNIEGPFENGCHCEVNDAISLCIETTSHLHYVMTQLFADVKRIVNEGDRQPWKCSPTIRQQFEDDPKVVVREYLRRLLDLHSATLRSQAWEEHRKAIDDEDRTYQRGQFATTESKIDFNNWLYRRYNLWNLETHIQDAKN